MFRYGRQYDIERLKYICSQGGVWLGKLNKMPYGKLVPLPETELCDINHPCASTLTARYYKGIGAHKDNLVIEVTECR